MKRNIESEVNFESNKKQTTTTFPTMNDDCWRAICKYMDVNDHITMFHTSHYWRQIILDLYRSGSIVITTKHMQYYEDHPDIFHNFWKHIGRTLNKFALEQQDNRHVRTITQCRFTNLTKFRCSILDPTIKMPRNTLKSILQHNNLNLTHLTLENIDVENFQMMQHLQLPKLIHFSFSLQNAKLNMPTDILEPFLEPSRMNLRYLSLTNITWNDFYSIQHLEFPKLTNFTFIPRNFHLRMPAEILREFLEPSCSNLQQLTLGGMSWKYLPFLSKSKFPNLTHLNLSFTSDKFDLQTLRSELRFTVEPNCVNVEHLTLENIDWRDFALMSHLKFPKLVFFEFSSTGCKNANRPMGTLKTFLEPSCANIEELILDVIEWENFHILSQLRFPKLKKFSFSPLGTQSPRPTNTLRIFLEPSCQNIQHLTLNKIGWQDFVTMSDLRFPKLHSFKFLPRISSFSAPPDILKIFLEPSCNNLLQLGLENIEWKDFATLQHLKFPHLNHLHLITLYAFAPKEKFIGENFPELKKLILKHVPSLYNIWTFPKLTELSLDNCVVLPQYLTQMFQNLGLEKLTIISGNDPNLRICDNPNLTEYWKAISECQTLKELNVDHKHHTMIRRELPKLSQLRKIRAIPTVFKKCDDRY